MSKTLDNARLTDIIQSATREMVEKTEAFIQAAKGKPAGPDTVSVMVNGKETILSQEDYAKLKAQTESIKLKRKADIKALVKEFKSNLTGVLKD